MKIPKHQITFKPLLFRGGDLLRTYGADE